jgi:hypothetical protein
MIKRASTKAPSLAPVTQLRKAALVQVTAGTAPTIDAQSPVVWMREIVHVQSRK